MGDWKKEEKDTCPHNLHSFLGFSLFDIPTLDSNCCFNNGPRRLRLSTGVPGASATDGSQLVGHQSFRHPPVPENKGGRVPRRVDLQAHVLE